MGYETYYVSVTNSRSSYTGFNDVTIARPKFIYFQATGLRPNTRHFVFFDRINVTNYVNTSTGTISDFNNLSRNDSKRNPGEKYINETGFPTDLGGPTSQIFSDDEGKIDGVFYLQSNSAINFPTGKRTLTVMDVSVYNLDATGSYSSAFFTIDGGIENYSVSYYTSQQARTRYVADPPPDPPPEPEEEGSSDPVVDPDPPAPVDPDPIPPDPVDPDPPEPEPEPEPEPDPPEPVVEKSKKIPTYLISGNERYQKIGDFGYIFKTNPVTGRPEVVQKSKGLGEALGEQLIGYGGGRQTPGGKDVSVGDALVKAGFGGLDGISTTNVLASEGSSQNVIVSGSGAAAFKLVHTGIDSFGDHDWIDQFSGEDKYIGEPGDDNYGMNPFFNQYAGVNL